MVVIAAAGALDARDPHRCADARAGGTRSCRGRRIPRRWRAAPRTQRRWNKRSRASAANSAASPARAQPTDPGHLRLRVGAARPGRQPDPRNQHYELDVFEGRRPAARGTAPLVVAYGVALRLLEAGRCRLRCGARSCATGAFERLELPIAVAVLTLITGLAIFNIFRLAQLHAHREPARVAESNRNFLLSDPRPDRAATSSPPRTRSSCSRRPGRQRPALRVSSSSSRSSACSSRVPVNKGSNTGEITQPQSALGP